jgi:hypothetical protein
VWNVPATNTICRSQPLLTQFHDNRDHIHSGVHGMRVSAIFRWRVSGWRGINRRVFSLCRVRADEQEDSHLLHACGRHHRGALFGSPSTNSLLLRQPAVLAVFSGWGDSWHRRLDRHRARPGGMLKLSPAPCKLLPVLRRPTRPAAARSANELHSSAIDVKKPAAATIA